MGTSSTTKVLKNVLGSITEFFALTTSAGAADAQAIPALNASGFLDPTIVNAKTVSAGAGDVGKLPQLDATGRIDSSVLPVGVGAESETVTTSEALAAGNYVNIWNNAGVAAVRKADASVAGKEANGFVLAAFGSGVPAQVYAPSQTNTQLSGMTPGAVQFLSNTAPGGVLSTAPTTSGHVIQKLGRAAGATSMIFSPTDTITLA
jgi:hypothetical protein